MCKCGRERVDFSNGVGGLSVAPHGRIMKSRLASMAVGVKRVDLVWKQWGHDG